MLVPNAETIEQAIDSLPALPVWMDVDQTKELHEALGADRLVKLGTTVPLSTDLIVGYRLGLATARTVLAGSATLILANVKPEDVL